MIAEQPRLGDARELGDAAEARLADRGVAGRRERHAGVVEDERIALGERRDRIRIGEEVIRDDFEHELARRPGEQRVAVRVTVRDAGLHAALHRTTPRSKR